MDQNAVAAIRRSIEDIIAAARARDGKAGEAEARLAELTTAQTKIGTQLTALQQRIAEGQIRGLNVPGLRHGGRVAALEALVKGREADLQRIARERGRITLHIDQPVQVRTIVSDSGDSPSSGYPAAAGRDPTPFYADPRRTLSLIAALAHLPVTTGVHEFVRLSDPNSPPTEDSNADVAPEGTLKPEGDLHFTKEQTQVDTVAVWARISTQLMNDVPGLVAEIGDLFMNGVASKLERRAITALLAAAPLYTDPDAGGFPLPDKISGALAALEARDYVQPIVLLHPGAWHDLRTSRATGGSEEYLSGSFSQPAPRTMWNAPVVVNSAINQGTLLIVDRTAARFLDRQQPTVEISTEDQDNFVKNLATIRAELRGAVEILRPYGMLKLDLTESG